jgi:hypothetical protein
MTYEVMSGSLYVLIVFLVFVDFLGAGVDVRKVGLDNVQGVAVSV